MALRSLRSLLTTTRTSCGACSRHGLSWPDRRRSCHVLIAQLLERSARATPAEFEHHEHGAVLRHTSDDAHWWAGASLLHGDDVEAMVEAAESFAADRGAAAQVHVCPGCPPGLDSTLAARGYRRHTDVVVMTATPADVLEAEQAAAARLGTITSEPVVLRQRAVSSWFDEQTLAMLSRVDALSAYAAAVDGGSVVSVGRAVVDDGWAGVFSMRTRQRARRRGYARAVLARLADWAGEHASGLYLQVRLVDEPALQLYRGMGFVERGRYHYRQALG